MGQHRRVSGALIILIGILSIPSVVIGMGNAAERADECAAVATLPAAEKIAEETKRGLKCN